MSASDIDKEFVAYVVESLQSIGPVQAKRMFGGYGIFLDELMFGLISDGVLYFKVDGDTESEFKQKGLAAFSYNKKGKLFKLSYYQAPDESLEDSEVMNLWANKAYAVALRAAVKKK